MLGGVGEGELNSGSVVTLFELDDAEDRLYRGRRVGVCRVKFEECYEG